MKILLYSSILLLCLISCSNTIVPASSIKAYYVISDSYNLSTNIDTNKPILDLFCYYELKSLNDLEDITVIDKYKKFNIGDTVTFSISKN